MDRAALERGLANYIIHLKNTERRFNECAAEVGLPVQMRASSAIKSVESGVGLARITSFFGREDDTGIVHETQLKTAVESLWKLLNDKNRCGHVVGAMQSGKTTTSLALQWAGPVIYLLTGRRPVPFYVIGNQTNHEDQTKTELDRFLAYYGNLEIESTQEAAKLNLDAVFAASPSINNYREHVLRETLEDVYAVPRLEDIVHRRVGGERSVRKIAELCRRATGAGYEPLMIIDEPQFGASDRLVVTDDGGSQRRPCVLVQIFDRIEQELGAPQEGRWFVGLSATPFELNDLERVWEVRQTLTPAYSGFNFFNGTPISPGVNVTPPKTLGLTDFSSDIGIPFIAAISMAAYDGTLASFRRHAAKIDFSGDQDEYKSRVEEALRNGIYAQVAAYGAEDPSWAGGLCIRAFNDNGKTEALIARLNLDPEKIEVIRYFGNGAVQMSVKRMIARRQREDLPYVVFVTNRARMADAFPTEVRFFLDFAQRASDLNALLQGLLGRACGYNKKSTVVLSDENDGIVAAYVATKGGYVHRTSRHSVAVGGYRRGAPTGMIKLRREMADNDPVVKKFFEEIDRQVVSIIPPGSPKLKVARAKGGAPFRTGPILKIAKAVDLFDHIEGASVRANLFPEIPTGFQVVREGERIKHARTPGVTLTYSIDASGNCRYTFRWSERDAAAQGGAAGRAKGKKDSAQHIEPTVYVEKYDASTGEVINDRTAPPQRPGNWRAFMVTFPLRVPVQEIRAATVALPTELCAYNPLMTEAERATRDEAAPPPPGATTAP